MNVKKTFLALAALLALGSLAAAEGSPALKMDSLDEIKKIAAQNNLKEVSAGENDWLAMSEDSKSFALWRVKDEADACTTLSIVCLDEKVHSRAEIFVKRGLKLRYILEDGQKICSTFLEDGDSVKVSENMCLYFAIICIYDKCQALDDLEKSFGAIIPETEKNNAANFQKTFKKKKGAVRNLRVPGMREIVESAFTF